MSLKYVLLIYFFFVHFFLSFFFISFFSFLLFVWLFDVLQFILSHIKKHYFSGNIINYVHFNIIYGHKNVKTADYTMLIARRIWFNCLLLHILFNSSNQIYGFCPHFFVSSLLVEIPRAICSENKNSSWIADVDIKYSPLLLNFINSSEYVFFLFNISNNQCESLELCKMLMEFHCLLIFRKGCKTIEFVWFSRLIVLLWREFKIFFFSNWVQNVIYIENNFFFFSSMTILMHSMYGFFRSVGGFKICHWFCFNQIGRCWFHSQIAGAVVCVQSKWVVKKIIMLLFYWKMGNRLIKYRNKWICQMAHKHSFKHFFHIVHINCFFIV